MTRVFSYRLLLAEVEIQLKRIEAKIDYLCQRLHKTPLQVIADDLSEAEVMHYQKLLSRFEHFKQWEAVEHGRN